MIACNMTDHWKVEAVTYYRGVVIVIMSDLAKLVADAAELAEVVAGSSSRHYSKIG